MNILEQVRIKAAESLIPVGVHVDLTYRCHQRCIHCYLPETWRQSGGPGPELTTSQVKAILDQLAEAGTFLLTLSGGEVFLRPDLFLILEHARRLNFAIALMTSGAWGLDIEALRFLKDLGLQGLVMTLFGLKAPVHDIITMVNGSWEKTMQTVRRGKALGLPIVLNCIAFSVNFAEIKPLKQFTAQEDIPLRLDHILLPRWDGQAHNPNLLLTPQEQNRLFEMLEVPEEAVPEPPGCPLPETPPGGCGAGWRGCYITPTGKVWPCPEVPIVCGDLHGKQQFAEIWHDSCGFKKLRAITADPQEEVMICKIPSIQKDFSPASFLF